MRKFSLVLANFPFSDEFWWLKPEQQTDDKKKKDKLKKEIFGKEGFKDPYGRFGRGTPFKAPPAGYGDYAFILHILASLDRSRPRRHRLPAGRAVPRPAGGRGGNRRVRRRRQPEHQAPQGRRRTPDPQGAAGIAPDRRGDSLPLNVFYGAGVPACLLILRKQRRPERHDKVLLVYAARHFRELSTQNELRPQDVMRILVHATHMATRPRCRHWWRSTAGASASRSMRASTMRSSGWKRNIADAATRLAKLETEVAEKRAEADEDHGQDCPRQGRAALAKLEGQRDKAAAKIAERDEKIAEARRRAEDDRRDVEQVGAELGALYGDPDELLKHARVVDIAEIEENEFNLNIPRYVDTFEPEPRVDGEGCAEGAARCGEPP